MNEEPKYTIAMCNYNMDKTLEESVRSIVEQVTNEFEVLVVDDGSDDNSLKILKELSKEYDNFRFKALKRDKSRKLGETRNIANREARGKYVLTQLDADDKYGKGILDFVEIYHQIEKQVDFEFYLSGKSINMAPKELLLEIPYRNLRSQDADLWRRLADSEALIWLDHESFCQEIRSKRNIWEKLKRNFRAKVIDFQVGITFFSWLEWALFSSPKRSFLRIIYNLIACPIAYLIAKTRKQYETPEEYRKKWALRRKFDEIKGTISEIEEIYNVEIDRSKLSERGREIFCKVENNN
ncbi:MAG: glycosyltransferase family 2 protein [Elusimicrobiota bacterium]